MLDTNPAPVANILRLRRTFRASSRISSRLLSNAVIYNRHTRAKTSANAIHTSARVHAHTRTHTLTHTHTHSRTINNNNNNNNNAIGTHGSRGRSDAKQRNVTELDAQLEVIQVQFPQRQQLHAVLAHGRLSHGNARGVVQLPAGASADCRPPAAEGCCRRAAVVATADPGVCWWVFCRVSCRRGRRCRRGGV